MSRLGSIGGRLYRGEVAVDFVGRQRLWYIISGVILVVSVASLATLGLNLGVEFKGGSVFQFKAPSASTTQVRDVVKSTGEVHGDPIVQSTSTGWRVQTGSLNSEQATEVQQVIAKRFALGSADDVAVQTVGASWGADVSKKALQGLIIFLLLVIGYLWAAFEVKMAIAAIIALAHDIVITIGVYSLVQFEVTPASVIGLLTILGYSLYDTVVVFDKVRENTRSLAPGSSLTYSQAANRAVNQTLVRSINTSVIALLPVGALLFIGAGLLRAGTLKDLSLVLFVGMLAGTYSSICIATPILADLKEREPRMKELRARIAARGASAKRQAKQSARSVPPAPDGSGAAAGQGQVKVTEVPGGAPEGTVESGKVPHRRMVQQGQRIQPQRGTRRSRKK